MNSLNVVSQPSDYLDAIQERLKSLLVYQDQESNEQVDFLVEAYSEFGKTALIKPSIFIEITKAKGSYTKPDGRVYENLDVALHSVFPNSMPYAGKLANNSSFDIREIIIVDASPKKGRAPHWRWGLQAETVRRPENIDRMPSIFMDGAEGYEGWCVSFVQEVTYGPISPDEPSRESIFFAFNADINDVDKYQELTP